MADTLLGGILINEILVDPNGALNFDTDANGTAAATDEYVELYNSSNSAIDISGLELWDGGVGNWFTFPPGTILQPGAHALVISSVQSGGSLPTGDPGDLFFDAGRGSPLINNGGDNVVLFDPTSDTFVQATYNGDPLDDPTLGGGGYAGFSATATRIGSGENFGDDTDGLSVQRAGDGSDTFTTDAPTPGVTNVCFASGTLLATPEGERPVEHLKVGDKVVTVDQGVKSIAWVFSKTWSPSEVVRSPNLAAVLISKGAFGLGLPSQDLRLSQLHRVLVQGPIAKRMFDVAEVLIPAKALLALEGVCIELPKDDITYYHVMLESHEVLYANGILAESLYLGRQALKSVPKPYWQEIETILGTSIDTIHKGLDQVQPARVLSRTKRAKRLVKRHAKNRRPLLVTYEANIHPKQDSSAV